MSEINFNLLKTAYSCTPLLVLPPTGSTGVERKRDERADKAFMFIFLPSFYTLDILPYFAWGVPGGWTRPLSFRQAERLPTATSERISILKLPAPRRGKLIHVELTQPTSYVACGVSSDPLHPLPPPLRPATAEPWAGLQRRWENVKIRLQSRAFIAASRPLVLPTSSLEVSWCSPRAEGWVLESLSALNAPPLPPTLQRKPELCSFIFQISNGDIHTQDHRLIICGKGWLPPCPFPLASFCFDASVFQREAPGGGGQQCGNLLLGSSVCSSSGNQTPWKPSKDQSVILNVFVAVVFWIFLACLQRTSPLSIFSSWSTYKDNTQAWDFCSRLQRRQAQRLKKIQMESNIRRSKLCRRLMAPGCSKWRQRRWGSRRNIKGHERKR